MSKKYKNLYFETLSAIPPKVLASVYRLLRLLLLFCQNSPTSAKMQVNINQLLCCCLFIFLTLPISCSCFPDESQAIVKEREWDKKTKLLQREMEVQDKALRKGLEIIKSKFPSLDKTQLFQRDEVRSFFKDTYIPYLRIWKDEAEHLKKHEREPSKRKKIEKSAQSASHYLEELPKWIQKNDTGKMYELIKKLIDEVGR